MQFIEIFNLVVAGLFFLCYCYQFVYVLVSVFGKMKPHQEPVMHRFAVLIAARNEENVIANLIRSLREQTYPGELVDIYVVADNCTDKTAWVARAAGATVFERSNKEQVGKGYALNFLIGQIKEHVTQPYDAYLVFDADNIADPEFITEINKVYSDGYEAVTGYRNSKNFGDNWISAGYGLCYMRECRCLNHPRQILGASSTVTGTGFLFSEKFLQDCGGWKFFLLTEDWEFTMDTVARNEKIGYAKNAVVYDEQPVLFRQSWTQRLRWCRGYLQVMRRYGKRLLGRIIRGNFSCYDATMSILPAAVLSSISLLVNLIVLIIKTVTGGSLLSLAISLGVLFMNFFLALFAFGLLTTILEWKRIHCSAWKKLWYSVTFPVFMFTYLPIYVVSFFARVEWKPITHTKSMTYDEIVKQAGTPKE